MSLPQLTFEPYTSTKTSILIAQKKTKEQIKQWNELWDEYGQEWSKLKTRIVRYYDYFVKKIQLNKKFVFFREFSGDINRIMEDEDKQAIDLINKKDTSLIKENIYRFLKNHITIDDDKLDIKELLEKYSEEIESLAKHDKETEMFGFYNFWWVFSEVAKELDYKIFMAEVENIGYKRTKRGERQTPNELYDIEFAPTTINSKIILKNYEDDIEAMNKQLQELHTKLNDTNNKRNKKEITERLKRLKADIEELESKINQTKLEKDNIYKILDKYYKDDRLREEFLERTDNELINHFKDGVLSKYKSTDILLRTNQAFTILDAIREEIVWE